MSNLNGNTEYKSDTFSMLLEEPKNALEVYNALNGSNYTDAGIVEMKTLDRGISLSVRNDAAFIVDTDLNMYEHQSSYNPNMPLRHLIYFTKTIEQLVENRDLFSRKKITVPTPHFVVFYNGIEKRPETEIMRFSDSFEKAVDNPEIELLCTVYNINPGNNNKILSKCPALYGYMIFVEKIRSKIKEGISLKDAINMSIDECINEGYIADFLQKRRDEVTKISMIDMTFETREKLIRKEEYEDGRAEGIVEGIAEGRLESIALLLQNGGSEDDARRLLKATDEEIIKAKEGNASAVAVPS